jgi:hypothetical protein
VAAIDGGGGGVAVTMLMMLSQENKTKYLNVCLIQHRLEEGSEVV